MLFWHSNNSDDDDESHVGDGTHLEEQESSDEERAHTENASIEDFDDELMEIQDWIIHVVKWSVTSVYNNS